MSLSFSRSMRSLQSDSFRPSLATLVIASILIAAWLAWLAFAPVTLYATSQDWQAQRDGSLSVRFPAEAMARFRPGQSATLALPDGANQPAKNFAAMVADIPSRTQNRLAPDTIKVTLLSGALSKDATGGEVKIAVETVTPLILITRATSQITAR
ncbi:MAG: hypothetical protein HZC40_02850 [Chloroflexi bacterium]|nr:hypothetical protein [Chloroflexota bacterium]